MDKRSNKKPKKEISTAIVGLSFPSEIQSFKEIKKLKEIEFILLDVSEQEREKRLLSRNASEEVIKDLEQLHSLRKEFNSFPEKIIDTTNYSIEEVLKLVSNFIKK